MAKYLKKADILDFDDTIYEEVEVPEWGGTIRVVGLSGADRDEYETSIISTDKKGNISFNMKNMRARLISLCAIDENGKKLFSDRDVNKLGQKSGAALDRIYSVCQRISGLENENFNKALENLAITPSGDSTSN